LFRLLGLHPGPDIGAAATASLAGVPPGRARQLLAELVRAHLIAEHVPGRYAFYDLLRAFATELAGTEPGAARQAAAHRLLDHYVHTAAACAARLSAQWEPLALTGPVPGATPERIADYDAAMAWLIAEQPVLLAAAGLAYRTGLDAPVWQLARTLMDFFELRGHYQDWVTIHLAALDATRRAADHRAQARTHVGLGRGYLWQGRYHESAHHLELALRLFKRLGDRSGEALTQHNLAMLANQQDRHGEALGHAHDALALCRAVGDTAGVARELNSIGWCHALLGDYRQTLVHCQEALALQRELGDRCQECATLDSLGYAHHHLGQYVEAADCFREAIEVCRIIGDRCTESCALIHLGDTLHATGHPDAAHDAWQHALDILVQSGNPNTDEVLARLHPVHAPPAPVGAGAVPQD
jgi:tetratricopeptide (TPR) repeat protein